MKNLANCKPSEFLAQTFKIKKSVADWLDATKFLEIRKNVPELKDLKGLTGEEREKAINENKKKINDQIMKNLSDILDKALDENADKTLEVLALCCFVEPEHVDDYSMSDYFQSIKELLADENVMGFFISLTQLGMKNMASVSNP